ncbi:hypothetical protein D3C72_1566240 [compost metagenome]
MAGHPLPAAPDGERAGLQEQLGACGLQDGALRPADRPAQPHRQQGSGETGVSGGPQRSLPPLPGLRPVQEAAQVGDGRRAGGDLPPLCPHQRSHRARVGGAAGRSPHQAAPQRPALVEEERRRHGQGEGDPLWPDPGQRAAHQLQHPGSRPVPRAVHPPRPGGGGLRDPPSLLRREPQAAGRGGGAGAQVAPARHPGG